MRMINKNSRPNRVYMCNSERNNHCNYDIFYLFLWWTLDSPGNREVEMKITNDEDTS